jgi:hypothetical protein
VLKIANPIVVIIYENNKMYQKLIFHHKWVSKKLVVSNDQANPKHLEALGKVWAHLETC